MVKIEDAANPHGTTDDARPWRYRLACTDGPGAWAGSELRFQLTETDEQVFVTLTHSSATATDDEFLYFSTKWPVYLLSLRDFLESGAGRPYPRDVKIHVGD